MDALFKWIDSQQERMLNWVIHWSNCNSGSHHLSGLAAMHDLLWEAFSPLKATLTSIPLGSKKALCLKKNPQAPLQILFVGHYDTVFGVDSPFQCCQYQAPNKLVGPGVCDMKGGLAILRIVLEALEKEDTCFPFGWTALLTPDEEIGSLASTPLFKTASQGCSLGLIFEPALPDGSLVCSRKGSLNLLVQAQGIKAHAGRDFFQGKNALTALMEWAINCELLTDIEKQITVNIGKMSGGQSANVVAQRAECLVNVRTEKQEDLEMTLQILKELACDVEKKRGTPLTLTEQSYRPPKYFDFAHQQIFNLIKTSALKLGTSLQWKPSGGVCDGNLLASFGLPTIDTLGGIGGLLHTEKEFLLIDSLKERAKLTLAFLIDYLKEVS